MYLLICLPQNILSSTLQQEQKHTKSQPTEIPISSAPRHFNLQLRVSRFFFRPCDGQGTYRVSLKAFLKAGQHISFSEARTLEFVASHTSIPVPKVLKMWRHPRSGVPFILMEFVRGEELTFVWNRMSQKEKERVVDQLKGYMRQLRNLEPPTHLAGRVCAVDGGPLVDMSRIDVYPTFGPFPTHSDFHRFLRVGLSFDRLEEENKPGYDKIIYTHTHSYASKFSHADFAPRNILVKRDGTITVIVDWAYAGWYPEYWEYTRARYSPFLPHSWIPRIGEMTGQYDQELAGEMALWRDFSSLTQGNG